MCSERLWHHVTRTALAPLVARLCVEASPSLVYGAALLMRFGYPPSRVQIPEPPRTRFGTPGRSATGGPVVVAGPSRPGAAAGRRTAFTGESTQVSPGGPDGFHLPPQVMYCGCCTGRRGHNTDGQALVA